MRHLLLLLTLLLSVNALIAQESSLTIVSYNIRYDAGGDRGPRDWDQRKKKVTDYLTKNKASIIGMQEVLHSQLLNVDRALPNHTYIGVGRSDGKKSGEYSPIFYDQKIWKLDPKQHGTFWLSDTPKKVASTSWGNRITRICTWARLISKSGKSGKSGKPIYIYNTHWDHRSQPSRVKAAELIVKTIQARKNPQEPFILMGDFNATTENPAIKSLLNSGILIDPGKKQFRTFNSWKAQLVPGLRIDHIFISTSMKNAAVVVESNSDPEGNAASDHHPVVLRLNESSFR